MMQLDNDRRPERPRFVEYPLSASGELIVALDRTLLPMIAGVVITFLLGVVIGIVGEEGLFPTRELTKAVDMFMRFSMAPIVVGGVAAWLLASMIQVVKQRATARALVRAAGSGARRRDVPHRDQLALATGQLGSMYRSFAFVHFGVLGLFIVISAFVLLFNDFDGAWMIVVIPLAWMGVLGLGYLLLTRGIEPRHRERGAEIARHWPSKHREEALSRATKASRQAHSAGRPGTGRRISALVLAASGPLALAALVSMMAGLMIAHPHAQLRPGGQLGDRGSLSDAADALVDLLVSGTAILTGLSVACLVVGATWRTLITARERRRLRLALADPAASRPDEDALGRHSSIRSELFAQLLAALAGAALCLGVTGTALATWDVAAFARVYRTANDVFEPLVGTFRNLTTAGLLLLGGAVVVNAVTTLNGRDLRNALQARWPSIPAKKDAGPAVTPDP